MKFEKFLELTKQFKESNTREKQPTDVIDALIVVAELISKGNNPLKGASDDHIKLNIPSVTLLPLTEKQAIFLIERGVYWSNHFESFCVYIGPSEHGEM